MAKIAYILLCHKHPDAIIRQAERLTAVGDYMAIHFDASSRGQDYAKIRDALDDNPNVIFPTKRVRCGWGEWSLVQATLNTVQAALAAFPRATHCYMLSGDCMAIKSALYAHQYLDDHDLDFIESVDYFESKWIKTGWLEERLVYRHFFNERKRKRLFYASYQLQKRLGLKREIPSDLQMMIGSQWWCLRRHTLELILEFTQKRRDVIRFFRTTWIPDETFFQTLVRHLVAKEEIESRTLTFLMFSDYGMPVTIYNDHYDLLLSQNHLFARKISPHANDLKRRLGQLYVAERSNFQITDEGRNLFQFLSGQGRIGRRFANRFWETESTLGHHRELLIVVCKKWHVAKRLLEQIKQHVDIPAIEYMFSETHTPLPDLGGIQKSLEKRHRHRRALMRMLFDYFKTDRLIVCMDPSNLDLMTDFTADRSTTRILEVECQFTDAQLRGHAMRMGLAGEQTSDEAIHMLLPTVRNNMVHESDLMREAQFEHHLRVQQTASEEVNVQALCAFLGVPHDVAAAVLSGDDIFTD